MLPSYSSTQPLSLREILPDAEFVGAADVRAKSVTCDSLTCRPGDVFVALAGTRSDGHEHVQEAAAHGAAAVVVDHPVTVDVPACLVLDSSEAFGHICQALANHPTQKLHTVGITGTNGKSTTAALVASVFEAAGSRTGTLGTLGYCDGYETLPAELTTPPAPELAHWLSRMVALGCSHAAVEVSSHALAQRRIAGIEFAHVCVTNLRRDHLDYHTTLSNYHHAKIGLVNYLRPGGVAVINADDPQSIKQAPLLPGRVISVGMHAGADVSAVLLERVKSEQTFLLTAGNVSVPVRTALIGDHHIYNCLMATAIGLAEGIDLTTVVRGLESVTRVPGRLERIECGQPFGVYVDYAHTPDALRVSLETLRQVTSGRIICVFGAGGNRDTAKRPLMGRAVEELADVAVVTTDNPRFEDPQSIGAEIIAGFARPALARWIADRTEAIHYALWLAGPDDCVLVAGRGHEPFQQMAHERIALDDCDVVRRYLYNLAPSSPYGGLQSVSNS
ncbi:MAG: UDP-N-acetylmuramoyl-L-alanyl-D-glutamate--2,6-diaminopimelate ligase [Pirellulales bacterium]